MTMSARITGGVDTHLDVHVAAALDERGAVLGVESFETTPEGYQLLLDWLAGFGRVELVGVEGTGSYGAGLTRHFNNRGMRVVEVDRLNRQRRRRRGKSDPEDAISAARSAQSGDSAGSIISTAPDEIRGELRDLSVFRMVERASAYRPANRTDLVSGTKYALRVLRAVGAGLDTVDFCWVA